MKIVNLYTMVIEKYHSSLDIDVSFDSDVVHLMGSSMEVRDNGVRQVW